MNVDAQAGRHPINPHIYGLVLGSRDDLAATNFTVNRGGGNGTSTYNWQINAADHASDWYFESIPGLSQTSGFDAFITQTRAAHAGAEPLLTIPMINYLAKIGANGTKLWSYSIAKYGPQTGADPSQPDAGNGISAITGQPIAGNNPLDAHTPNSVSIQQAWIQHLIGTWGLASKGGVQYYIMDNEPSLWSRTHRDIHPSPATYDEILSDYLSYAGAVRSLDPKAMIVGPEEWSWLAMFLSGYDQLNGIGAATSDYNTHNRNYYYPWLLQQLYAHQQSTGEQLLNVLSTHYFPVELHDRNDDSAEAQLVRNRSTRALWDPNYVDPSWSNQAGLNAGVVNLIPTLQGWVNQFYPGLQTGITGYSWSDESNLNGATTQADILGIFGREGLDLATRAVPVNPSPTYLALQIYRNYDGNLSTFGDTSVSAMAENPDKLSSFAAVRSSDGALTVMVINKQQGSTPLTLNLSNFDATDTAQAYQIASATQTGITELGGTSVDGNSITTTLPSQSITLFVIPSRASAASPATPNGLTATVASGTVMLTWNASSGATSYTVSRGAAKGGPYASIATVDNTSPGFTNLQPWGRVPYTDNGLTNGTTYYYVVSATNTSGTSPNSAELAVTPIAPPEFSSNATASPSPATQGSSTTVQATVACTSNTLANGVVEIRILDPNGNPAATQTFPGQSFTAQQSHPYSLSFTPAMPGTYAFQVGVFGATGQLWSWNSSAGSVTVNSSVVFTSSAVAPSTVAPGGTAPISVTVTETGAGSLTNGNVQLQILNSAGSAVATQVWNAQNFSAGLSSSYSYTWIPLRSLTPGTYSVQIAVFDANWTYSYHSNIDAAITLTSTATPTGITATSGTPQSTAIGTAFPKSLQATVKDANGNPVSGVSVTFTVPSNGASAAFGTSVAAAAITNSSGQATAPALTANGTIGAYIVRASVAGLSAGADFSLTNTAGAPASITATAGTPQSAVTSTAFATALQVTVKDTGGNPVSGITVTFTAPSTGAGAVFGASATATATTNNTGQATAPAVTANTTAGTYSVIASVAGLSSTAGFSLTNTAGAPATITATAGTPQSAIISAGFTTALQATVRDAGGNPVSGVKVTFTAPSTGASAVFGSGATATATTDSSGQATAPSLTANAITGRYTVMATAAGLAKTAGFSLTNIAGSAATIAATAGTPQSAAVGTAFATALQATVKDSSGNPVSGVTVTFTAPSTGASALFGSSATATATTDANGQATAPVLTANMTVGSYMVTAAVSRMSPAAFTLTNTSGAPAANPTADSVTPSSGLGMTQSFAFKYSSPNGYAYLSSVYALINNGVTSLGACYANYIPSANALYLDNDTGTSWIGPMTPGGTGTLENSQCSINMAATTAAGSGNTLTLSLAVSFKASFLGAKTIFGYAYDNGGLNSGWKRLGTWTPSLPANAPPTADSVTPNKGSGPNQNFMFSYSSANGFNYLNEVFALINGSLSANGGCYVAYFPASNTLYLDSDTGPEWVGPLTPGTARTLQNDECVINGAATNVTGSGNTLSLTLSVSFKTSFAAPQTLFGYAYDKGGLNSGWQTLGTWTSR